MKACRTQRQIPPPGPAAARIGSLARTAQSVRTARMRAVLAVLAAALVATAFAYGATRVSGNLTLASFGTQACKFTSTTMPALPKSLGPALSAIAPGTKVLQAQCSPGSPATRLVGAPATRSAGYGWNWWLAVGKNGKTTGLAVELGQAIL